jgi:hypothetical protein
MTAKKPLAHYLENHCRYTLHWFGWIRSCAAPIARVTDRAVQQDRDHCKRIGIVQEALDSEEFWYATLTKGTRLAPAPEHNPLPMRSAFPMS